MLHLAPLGVRISKLRRSPQVGAFICKQILFFDGLIPKKKYTEKSPRLSPARWCPHATATLENSWRRGFCDRRDSRRHSAFLRRQRHHMGERERSRDPAERTKETVRGFCYN